MFCMHCRGPHDVVITVERDGFLRHYHACFDHIEQVANRLRSDVGARRLIVPKRDVIDTSETPPQLGA